MKKFFSDYRFLHVFYSLILLIVSGLFYFVIPAKLERLAAESTFNFLKDANEINSERAQLTTRDMLNSIYAFYNFQSQKLESALFETNRSRDELIKIVNKIQKELQVEIESNSNTNYLKYTSMPKRKILTVNKIKEIKRAFDSLVNVAFLNQIDYDRERVFVQQTLQKIEDLIPWNEIGELNAIEALAQLESIKNSAYTINICLQNFLYKRIGGSVRFDDFSIDFLPKQTKVNVGEPYIVDLAFCEIMPYLNGNNKIYCNGYELLTQRGGAPYQKTFQNAGKQKIAAMGILTNWQTGETDTVKELIINILPK